MKVRAVLPPSWIGVGAVLVGGAGWLVVHPALVRSFGSHYGAPAFHAWFGAVVNPFYWTFVLVLALLQWRWPADREQRKPSIALAEDAAWFLLETAIQVTVVAAFLSVCGAAYHLVTAGHQFDLTPYLGIWGVAVLAFVLSDGLSWASHWLHHNVKTLWLFHAVHHSQENLNALSDNREHVIETMIAGALTFFPAVALGLTSPDAIRLAFVGIYFSAFIHANIRTDLGPLRFLIVSPQSHRVHHSIEREHYDQNYATIFAFWDYIFGTRFPDRDVYPATGIEDELFPHGEKANPAALLGLWVRQMIYPFKGVVQKIRGV